MNTSSSLRHQRDQQIYHRFCQLQNTMPMMDCYARLGSEFYLSEESIRKIVRKAKP